MPTKDTSNYIDKIQRPASLVTNTICVKTGCGKMYITISSPQESYREVFAILGKAGGCQTGMLSSITRLATLCLNIYRPEVVIKQLTGIRCPSDSKILPSCSEAVAQMIKTTFVENDQG